jgi:hypothetical protein
MAAGVSLLSMQITSAITHYVRCHHPTENRQRGQRNQSLSITDWVWWETHRFDIFVPVVLCCFIHWCRFTLAVL